MKRRPRRSAMRLVLLGGLALGYGAFAYVIPPRRFPRLCPWYRLTGGRCPLCGLTTAIGLTLRGDVRAARRAYPQWPAMVALGLLICYVSVTAHRQPTIYRDPSTRWHA